MPARVLDAPARRLERGRVPVPRPLKEKDAVIKILLVEDNAVIRDMLSRRLVKRDFQVITADNGAAVAALALAEHPDLILMDMHLPVLDGWEATRRLKASDDTRAVPIIALTADAMAGDKEKAIEAGCDDYETKPIDLPRLLEKIHRLLEEREAP
jgi:two-component system cell cycle response regulator DivK